MSAYVYLDLDETLITHMTDEAVQQAIANLDMYRADLKGMDKGDARRQSLSQQVRHLEHIVKVTAESPTFLDPYCGFTVVVPRPNLVGFLRQVTKLGTVELLTAASLGYARECLRVLRIEDWFNAVHSTRASCDELRGRGGEWVLLDDLPYPVEKADLLGCPDVRHDPRIVNIQPYHMMPGDNGLMEALPKVVEALTGVV